MIVRPSDILPRDAIDLHVHSGPDVRPRICDDLELARACHGAGLHGALIKSHGEPTGSRACLASRAVPGVTMYGGLVLNRAAGGLNPAAIAALAGGTNGHGRIVWLPTRDADHEIAVKKRANLTVTVTEGGRPVAAFDAVAQAIADADLVLATGHVAPEEGLCLLAAARAAGCRRLLITHATAPISDYSMVQLDRAVRLGARIELCARNLFTGGGTTPRRLDPDTCRRAFDVIARFGADQVLLSSDLGDPSYPAPLDGLAMAVSALSGAGLKERDVVKIVRDTPLALIGPGPDQPTV